GDPEPARSVLCVRQHRRQRQKAGRVDRDNRGGLVRGLQRIDGRGAGARPGRASACGRNVGPSGGGSAMNGFHKLGVTGLFAALVGCAATEPALPPEIHESRQGPPSSPPATPAERKSIDLTTALRLAAGTNLDVLDARARVREAEGRASSADGYLLPVISAGAAVGNTRGTAQSSFGELKEVNFYTVNALGTLRIS